MAATQLNQTILDWSVVNEVHTKSLLLTLRLQINKANLLPVSMINNEHTPYWQHQPGDHTVPAKCIVARLS